MPPQYNDSDKSTKTEESGVSSILIMVFVILIIFMVVMYITDSAYLSTVSYPYLIMAGLLLFTLTKVVIMPALKTWYPLILIAVLFLGGWLISSLSIGTARLGATLLAFSFIADAIYTGYALRTCNKLSSTYLYTYASYASVIISLVLALTFGYAAI